MENIPTWPFHDIIAEITLHSTILLIVHNRARFFIGKINAFPSQSSLEVPDPFSYDNLYNLFHLKSEKTKIFSNHKQYFFLGFSYWILILFQLVYFQRILDRQDALDFWRLDSVCKENESKEML